MTNPTQLVEKDTHGLVLAICDYLENNGVGTSENLWIQVMPETPTISTVVVLTGGPVISGDPTRRITFQVLHRNPQAANGLLKAQEINNLLDNQWNVLTGFPGRIEAVSEAGASFKDDSGNELFPLNYVFTTTFRG